MGHVKKPVFSLTLGVPCLPWLIGKSSLEPGIKIIPVQYYLRCAQCNLLITVLEQLCSLNYHVVSIQKHEGYEEK